MSRALQSPASHCESAGGIEVAHVSLPKSGECANGDRGFCRFGSDHSVLLGIVDVLGHGNGADEVATIAIDHLMAIALEGSIVDIMQGLHRRLRGTRGAAATLCLIRQQRIEACAVGNVDLRCIETPMPLLFSPGILGSRVPKFRDCAAQLRPHTRLVLFSDGVSARLRHEAVRALSPREACASLIERHRRPEDDATVLIADLE